MANNLFLDFAVSIGATPSKRIDTPFALYELQAHNIMLHFIDFETYQIHQPGTLFLVQCFEAAQHINYKIITVWEDVWHTKQELIQSRIAAIAGIRKRIHARQTKVVRIDKETAAVFLAENHLQGATNAYYKFGLEWNDELIAVATFSKARTMFDGPVYYRSYELERFATKQGVTATGGLGKLINHFMRQHHVSHIMTYADADWGAGKGYQKLGFKRVEHTTPQQFLIDRKTFTRTYLHHTQLTEQDRNEKGLLIIANTGSLKFVLALQKA